MRAPKPIPDRLPEDPLGSENLRMDFLTFGVTGLALIVYGVAGVILFYAVVRLLLAAARFLDRH